MDLDQLPFTTFKQLHRFIPSERGLGQDPFHCVGITTNIFSVILSASLFSITCIYYLLRCVDKCLRKYRILTRLFYLIKIFSDLFCVNKNIFFFHFTQFCTDIFWKKRSWNLNITELIIKVGTLNHLKKKERKKKIIHFSWMLANISICKGM